MHATTILAVRHGGRTVLAGDGQVTLGANVLKQGARKIRRLHKGNVLRDLPAPLVLPSRFSRASKRSSNSTAATWSGRPWNARDWRSDRALRRMEAAIVADAGSNLRGLRHGDLIEPDDGI